MIESNTEIEELKSPDIKSKTSLQLRSDYMSKLAYTKVWPTQRDKTHQTCIIFDWDDTLFCTQFITEHNANLNDVKNITYPEKY